MMTALMLGDTAVIRLLVLAGKITYTLLLLALVLPFGSAMCREGKRRGVITE